MVNYCSNNMCCIETPRFYNCRWCTEIMTGGDILDCKYSVYDDDFEL